MNNVQKLIDQRANIEAKAAVENAMKNMLSAAGANSQGVLLDVIHRKCGDGFHKDHVRAVIEAYKAVVFERKKESSENDQINKVHDMLNFMQQFGETDG